MTAIPIRTSASVHNALEHDWSTPRVPEPRAGISGGSVGSVFALFSEERAIYFSERRPHPESFLPSSPQKPVRQDMDEPPSRPKHVRCLGSHRGYRQLRRGREPHRLRSGQPKLVTAKMVASLIFSRSSAMTRATVREPPLGHGQHRPPRLQTGGQISLFSHRAVFHTRTP